MGLMLTIHDIKFHLSFLVLTKHILGHQDTQQKRTWIKNNKTPSEQDTICKKAKKRYDYFENIVGVDREDTRPEGAHLSQYPRNRNRSQSQEESCTG